jgi:uncharacterized protein (DUF305 family)
MPTDSGSTSDRRPGAIQIALAVGGVIALLAVGAALGIVITLSRVDSATPRDPTPVDIGFAQDMSVHHLQAVSMAGWTRDNTADPVIHQLAFDIEMTQQSQVGQMAGWLNLWEQPNLPAPGQQMKWLSATTGHHSTSTSPSTGMMPGMATQDELAKLRSLSGRDLDIYFLQLMLRHHEGGLPMAQYAADHATIGPLRALARGMVTGQQSEIDLMKQALRDRGAQPLA